jgi:hypothetical protein
LTAEDEIAGFSCDIGDFLSHTSTDSAYPIIICMNAGESVKRHGQHLGGQFWLQGDRQMTVINVQFDRMKNDTTSICLAAVAEAVEWRHVIESGPDLRTAQRIVTYPSALSKLQTILVTGTIGLDMEDGHDIAYQRILSASAQFVNPPLFYPDDDPDFGGSDIADLVSNWMHTAAQASIGGSKQVLEDGAGVCDSENE